MSVSRHVVAGEEADKRSSTTVHALDLQPMPDRTQSSGKSLISSELLPTGLDNVSTAISMGNFAALADAPAEEIARARDDAKNGFAIGFHLYEANRWIYGDGAFGLRLAAWIARKAPDPMIDAMTLLMFRLRQVPDAILPSDEIAEMAKQAREVYTRSKGMNGTGATIRASRKSSIPKRIKSAFADEIALNRWQTRIGCDYRSGCGKAPIGSNHES